MSTFYLFPVQILREHLTGLDAAIVTCLADPDHKPVHKLRTETRRAEAILLLLGMIPQIPDHRADAAGMLRELKKLRRAAGTVRDLDVHRKLLEAFAEVEEAAAERAAERSSQGQEGVEAKEDEAGRNVGTAEAQPNAAGILSGAATELRETLSRKREKAALKLQRVLSKRQTKTTERAQALLNILQVANSLELPGPDLLRDAEALLTRDGLLGKAPIAKLDDDELHTVRKAAKKARYLAETLPDDATLASAAQRFEALQEAGGQWHDALQLARAARRHFGKEHTLTVTYVEDRDRKLEQYRAALQADVQEGKAKKEAAHRMRRPTRPAAKSLRG